jgi:hypothetical protein
MFRAAIENGNLAAQTKHTLQRCLRDYISESIPFEECATILQSIVPNLSFLTEVRVILATPAYDDTGSPAFRRDHRWEGDEDRRLLAAIHRYGATDWGTIAAFVGRGRTKAQCAQRWRRSLDPALRRHRWLPVEDATLVVAVKRHGERAWNRVAADLKSRCDVQCRGRWKTIKDRGVQLPKNPFALTEQTDDICLFDFDDEDDELRQCPESCDHPITETRANCIGSLTGIIAACHE